MLDSFDALNLETEYNQLNIEALELMKTEDYNKALELYQNLINKAKILKNNLLELEAIINFGVCLFFCGKIPEAIDIFESSIRMGNSINISKISNQIIINTINMLKLKAYVNLVLSNITYNKITEAKWFFDNLLSLINTIFAENDYKSKVMNLKFINNLFFSCDSISDNVKVMRNKENLSLDPHTKAIQRITLGYYEVLIDYNEKSNFKDNMKLDEWSKILKEESQNFKSAKDINGFTFALFNQTACNLLSDKQNSQTLKNKLLSLSKIITDERQLGNDNTSTAKTLLNPELKADDIIEMFKSKIELSSYIFKKIVNLDEELVKGNMNNSINLENDSEMSKKQVLILFISITLKQLNQNICEHNQMLISQLEYVKKSIENNDFDLNDIDLDLIDPDIFNSFKLLYKNLCMIRYKFTIRQYFKTYMFNTLGYKSRKALMEYKAKKFRIFSSKQLNYIRDGTQLTKVNYSSNGTKNHFYQLSIDDNCIKIFEKTGHKTFSKLFFSEIKKFSFGICTRNMRKKFKTLNSDPWECFSISTNKRSLDFISEEDTLSKWYYGLRTLFHELNEKKLICSVNYFRLTRLKMKMLNGLKETLDQELKPNSFKFEKEIKLVEKIIKEVTLSGTSAISFVKLLLLIKKIKGNNFK